MCDFFASNLKFLRQREGLTQGELANELGIKKNAISSYESNGVYPRIDGFAHIAKFFNVSQDDLCGTDLTKGSSSKPNTSLEESGIDQTLKKLNKDIRRYERIIKEKLPDFAKEIGLDDE